MKLGYLQQQMLSFMRRHSGPCSLSADYLSVKVARSLERRRLIRMWDVGMCTASGRPVYFAQINKTS